MPTLTLITTAANAGERLDKWLAAQLPEQSRTELQRRIKEGAVRLDGVAVKASWPVEPDRQISIEMPESAAPATVTAEAMALDILYEDNDLLIINKAAGMVVHPAPGHGSGTLVNAVLHHCPELEGVGGERRPGIVHRLDRDTSGLIVVAKTDRAHRSLQTQFANRTVYKEYLALIEGKLRPESGRITAALGRHPTDRKRQAVLPPDPLTGKPRGRDAVTEYHTVGRYVAPVIGSSTNVAAFTLVKVILHTGRTHQIRVHFAWLKHPVAGDTVYGYRKARLSLQRQFLHAHRLRLRLPSTGEEREFVAPLPDDLTQLLASLGADSSDG